MTIETGRGLYREILTTPDKNTFDPKFRTFTLEHPDYTTYINIGMWKLLVDFENAITAYFPNASSEIKDGKTILTIELEDFEYKIRERLVLRKVLDRGTALPTADIQE